MVQFRTLVSAFCMSAALGVVVQAEASELFSVQFAGPTPFFRVDQTTGALTVVNPSTAVDIGDLTSDTRPGHSTVWGVVLPTSDPTLANALVTINAANGNVSSTVNITGLQGAQSKITSLAFDPVTGVLYGNTTVSFGDTTDRLYRINPVTGAATLVGDIRGATGAPFSDVFALGFDQTGKLFGVANVGSELIDINPLTASAALIASLKVGADFDIASRPEDNVMFLTSTGTSALYTVDTSNGNLTFIGAHGPNLVGLAFVPEPQIGYLLAAGLIWLAVVARRRLSI